MSQPSLDQVWEQVKALSTMDQGNLRARLDSLLKPPLSPDKGEEAFIRRLLELGLISEVPPPITDPTPYQNRKLIKTKGRPLSEIIVEERR